MKKVSEILEIEDQYSINFPNDKKKEKVVYTAPELLEDIDNDYEYQRQNFYNLVEKGNDAIEGILELAKESEHPRTYEVAGNLIKQVAEVAEKLGDLQEKMKKLKEVPDTAPKNVTNALFVGSTAELQKMIRGN
jgi:DNA-binding ferritin-like protein